MITITYGRRIVWGESVTEAEHAVGLDMFESVLVDAIRALYPETPVRVRPEGNDSAARVDLNGAEITDRPDVRRACQAAFDAGCYAIAAIPARIEALREEAGEAGDLAAVATCTAALAGDRDALDAAIGMLI